MTEDQAIEAMARAIAKQEECECAEEPASDWTFVPCARCCHAARAALAAIRPYLDAQFAAGAEAMREACAREILGPIDEASRMGGIYTAETLATSIRFLPVPKRGAGEKV